MNYSEIRHFDVSCACERWTPYRFAWLNRLGGIDTYTFNLVSTETIGIERTSFTKYLSRWNAMNQTYSSDPQNRGTKVFDVQAIETFTVVSTWQTEEEHRWLAELFTSPAVYVIEQEPTAYSYRPIVITSNSVQIRNKRGIGPRLLSHTIEFIQANKIIIQRG